MTCAGCALVHSGVLDGVGEGSLWMVEGRDGPRWWDLRTNQKRRWPTTRKREYVLWLRAECCGGRVLWAANEEHLRYLEDYVGAELRERSAELWKSAGLSWRLPTWMKEAKHRDEVVHHLGRLRASLSDS